MKNYFNQPKKKNWLRIGVVAAIMVASILNLKLKVDTKNSEGILDLVSLEAASATAQSECSLGATWFVYNMGGGNYTCIQSGFQCCI
jgi:hypothetical protein